MTRPANVPAQEFTEGGGGGIAQKFKGVCNERYYSVRQGDRGSYVQAFIFVLPDDGEITEEQSQWLDSQGRVEIRWQISGRNQDHTDFTFYAEDGAELDPDGVGVEWDEFKAAHIAGSRLYSGTHYAYAMQAAKTAGVAKTEDGIDALGGVYGTWEFVDRTDLPEEYRYRRGEDGQPDPKRPVQTMVITSYEGHRDNGAAAETAPQIAASPEAALIGYVHAHGPVGFQAARDALVTQYLRVSNSTAASTLAAADVAWAAKLDGISANLDTGELTAT